MAAREMPVARRQARPHGVVGLSLLLDGTHRWILTQPRPTSGGEPARGFTPGSGAARRPTRRHPDTCFALRRERIVGAHALGRGGSPERHSVALKQTGDAAKQSAR